MLPALLLSLWALDSTARDLVDRQAEIDAMRRLPELIEFVRLPDVPTRISAQQRLGEFLTDLNRQASMAPPWGLDAIEDARGDCHRLQYLWALVEKAQDDGEQRRGPGNGCWTAIERRQALDELRREIGDRAFWSPVIELPMVPWWHLPRR